MKLTLQDCLNAYAIELSAVDVVNKLIFQPRKAYTTSTDNQTYFEFGSRIEHKINIIKKQILNKTYKFKPSKKIKRKTKLNKIRDIYLSTWDDKIVETWLNTCLNILLHSWFSKCAYAYRMEGLGIDSCQHKIAGVMKNHRFFAKRDVTKFFYTIDQDILLKQLAELVDENDFLYDLLKQRIKFSYEEFGEIKQSTLGLPFGSAIACTLSNIHLTELDKSMQQFQVYYFRYADDILIAGKDGDEVLRAAKHLDEFIINNLKLALKESYTSNFSFEDCPGFEKVNKFKYLGLEFMTNGEVKFSVEKQRKIMNFFDRELNRRKSAIRREQDLNRKLEIAIEGANLVIKDRIRSAAIVDYYLKHVNDEVQLRNMDRLLAEIVISAVTGKPFRKGHFRIVPYKKLRDMGLISLLHRNRLHKHGHLKISFLSLHNELVVQRYMDVIKRREERINHMRMSKKIREEGISSALSRPIL